MSRPQPVTRAGRACASSALPAPAGDVDEIGGAQIGERGVHAETGLTCNNGQSSTCPQPLLLESKTPLPPTVPPAVASGVDHDGADAEVGAGGNDLSAPVAQLVDGAIEILVDRELEQAFRSGPVYSRDQLRIHIRDRWRVRRREFAVVCAERNPRSAGELVDVWRMLDVCEHVAASARRMANIREDIDVAEWARYVFADVPDVDEAVTVAVDTYTAARPAGRQWWRDCAAELGAELGAARGLDPDTVTARAKARWWGDPELMTITVAAWQTATETKAQVH